MFLFLQVLVIWIVSRSTNFFQKTFQKNSIVERLPNGRDSFLCEGKLFRAPEVTEEGAVLLVALSQCAQTPEYIWRATQGKIRLHLMEGSPQLQLGDWIRFKASLHLPHDFQNHGSFQSSLYLRSQNIDAMGSISDPAWIVRLPAQSSGFFARSLEKMRNRIRGRVLPLCSPQAGGFILSLLIDDRGLLGKEWEDAFRNAGVSHILSISGLHVTIVAFLFLILFRVVASFPFFSRSVLFLRLYPVAAILPVWLYVAVASFPVAAVRAGVMATLVLVGLSVWRRLDLISSLAFAAILILSLSPLALFSASFQLSFAAVAFLLLFYPRWQKWRQRFSLPRVAEWLLDSLAVTVIAILGTLPLMFKHFHQFSLVGLFANLVIVPLVNFLVMPFGILGWFLTGLLGWDVSFLWKIVGWFSDWTLNVVHWFGVNADWGIFVGAFSNWQLVFYYGIFALLLLRRSVRWRLAFALPLVALVFVGGKMPVNGKLKITFVDVGQGDCAVIQLPNGKVWVVDGGGIKGSDWDIGRYVVAPYLWEEGIHKVDKLFLTHPHHDHYKGLGFLAEKFSPKILFVNGDTAPIAEIDEWQGFLKRIAESKVTMQTVTRLTKPIEEEDVKMEFFAPGPEGPWGHFDTNDNSAVMKLKYKNFAALLPGDLMEAGESVVMESKFDLKSDLLKLGHHGSNTSTTEKFLDQVDPKYAVISVGAYNTYGLPSSELIQRLQKRGIKVYRTDTQGAIMFETDGEKIDVKTFVP